MGNKLYWKATLRIVDDAGERCFGPGVAALLEGVEEIDASDVQELTFTYENRLTVTLGDDQNLLLCY